MKPVSLEKVPDELDAAFVAGDPDSAGKTQEQASVECLGRMVAAIAAGRFEELRGWLDPDVTFEIAGPTGLSWVGRAQGADAVAAAIAANFRTVRDQRTEPLALVAQGDTVMVMARESGRWVETGEPYEMVLAQQFTFRDGRLAAFRSVVAAAEEPPYAAA